jgi:hypothetical protein
MRIARLLHRVPAVYLRLPFVPLLSDYQERRINNLRILNRGTQFDPHRPYQSPLQK